MRRRPVVYYITNLIDGKVYVGSSVEYKKRWGNHKSALRKGSHSSVRLQRAWSKHGETNFEFQVVESAETHEIRLLEQDHINKLRSFDPKYGYNLVAKVELGFVSRRTPMSEATKAKISKAHKGRKYDAERCARMSENTKQQMHDPLLRSKISSKLNGRTLSQDTRSRMSASRKGKPGKLWTPERKAEFSLIAKARMLDPQARAKIAAGVSKAMENQELRDHLSEKTRQWVTNPDVRKMISECAKLQTNRFGGRK